MSQVCLFPVFARLLEFPSHAPPLDALGILLEYYGAQDLQGSSDWLVSVASVRTCSLIHVCGAPTYSDS